MHRYISIKFQWCSVLPPWLSLSYLLTPSSNSTWKKFRGCRVLWRESPAAPVKILLVTRLPQEASYSPVQSVTISMVREKNPRTKGGETRAVRGVFVYLGGNKCFVLRLLVSTWGELEDRWSNHYNLFLAYILCSSREKGHGACSDEAAR